MSGQSPSGLSEENQGSLTSFFGLVCFTEVSDKVDFEECYFLFFLERLSLVLGQSGVLRANP